MVFIPKGSQVFDQLPPEFESFFPSEQSLLDGKLASVLTRAGGKTGADLITRIQAESVTQGLQLVLQQKAMLAGDFLSSQLPQIVTFTSDSFGLKVPQGLFASVPFPTTILEEPILNAMAGVGLNLALNAISAIPIAGRIVALIVNIGMAIARLFGAQKSDPALPPLLVPWTRYQRDPDEDLVNKGLIQSAAGTVDWTGVWLPPLAGTWRYERASDANGKEMPGARVYAPLNKNSVAWDKGLGLGAIPNSLRVAGPVQTIVDTRLRDLGYAGDRESAMTWEQQKRFILRGDTREEAEGNGVYNELERPPTVIDTGAFFPAFGGIAGQLWQQVQQRGNPDQFKVNAFAVRDAWQSYWGEFFSDGFALLKKSLTSKSADDDQAGWVWAALTPYICVIQQNGKRVLLGMQNIMRPHPGPLVTENLFKKGPGYPGLNTPALYCDLGDEQLEGPGDMAIRSWSGEIISPARLSGRVRGGDARAVPWPSGEELLSYYKPPDQAIITPACDALRRAQLRSLETTLVSAYVRPDACKGLQGESLEPYAAFKDEGLRIRCREVRELLLSHDARFGVSLADVDAVDPPYAARLRAAGVGKPQAGGLKKFSNGKVQPFVEHPAGKDEAPIAPADGLAFDDVRRARVGRQDRSLVRKLAVGGLVVAATGATVAAIAAMRRKT